MTLDILLSAMADAAGAAIYDGARGALPLVENAWKAVAEDWSAHFDMRFMTLQSDIHENLPDNPGMSYGITYYTDAGLQLGGVQRERLGSMLSGEAVELERPLLINDIAEQSTAADDPRSRAVAEPIVEAVYALPELFTQYNARQQVTETRLLRAASLPDAFAMSAASPGAAMSNAAMSSMAMSNAAMSSTAMSSTAARQTVRPDTVAWMNSEYTSETFTKPVEVAAKSMAAAEKARSLYRVYEQVALSSADMSEKSTRMREIIDELNGVIPNLNAQLNSQALSIDGVSGSLLGAVDAFYAYAKAQAMVKAYETRLTAASELVLNARVKYDTAAAALSTASWLTEWDYFAEMTAAQKELKAAEAGMDTIITAMLDERTIAAQYEPMFTAAKKTAANTSKTASAIDLAAADLKYLRELAEREAVNQFTTAQIKVDMGGIVNNVNSQLDLDGIVSYIANGVENAMAIAGEGVH